MQRREGSAPFARVHSRITVNGPALWANVKRANAYSEAKVENDETGTGAPLLMGVSGVLGGGRRIDLGAATKALGGAERRVEGDRERTRASVPETSNGAALRSHG